MATQESVLGPCLLPQRRSLCGPVTWRRIARLWLIFLGVFLLGLAITQWADSARWKALGPGIDGARRRISRPCRCRELAWCSSLRRLHCCVDAVQRRTARVVR